MNDLYGLAPDAVGTVAELRARLSTFGPQTSRYLLSLPHHHDWKQLLLRSLGSTMGEIERKRLSSVLEAAFQNSAFIQKSFDDWSLSDDWVDSAIKYWRIQESRFGHGKIYVSDAEFDRRRGNGSDDVRFLVSPDENEVMSPAAEMIATEPEDYWKVAKLLCTISAEVHFVDPFFNPLAGEDKLKVFRAFVKGIMSLRKPVLVNFWVRWGVDGALREDLRRYSFDIRKELAALTKSCRPGLSFIFHWVDDRKPSEKMHARFLLTEKGGIQFDQGFQCLPNRRNLVSPLSRDVSFRQFELLTKQKSLPFKVLDSVRVSR